MPHHKEFYEGVTDQIVGGYSWTLHDYVDSDVIDRLPTPRGRELQEIVDPYRYRDRYENIPKLVINATGDEFSIPDASQFYFDDLPGEKYLRYVPNSGHTGFFETAVQFHQAIMAEVDLPEYDWSIEDGGRRIQVTTEDTPLEVKLWQAHNPGARDFRHSINTPPPVWQATLLSDLGGSQYVADVPFPESGATAFMVELAFDSGGARPFLFTTDISVIGASSVPEPSALLLALLTFGTAGAVLRKRSWAHIANDGFRKLGPFSLLIVVGALCTAAYGQGRMVNESLQHDGLTRRYSLYVPEAYTGDEAWPLVVNLHGATSNVSEQRYLTGMNNIANAGEFLVVYPLGTGSPRGWNSGEQPGRADDVGFIGTMLDELEATYHIDASRVYATGLSNGGAMSYLLGSQLPDRIAAVASVAGSSAVTTPRPLPALHMHGTADPVAPYEGGVVQRPIGPVELPSAADVVDAWRENNHSIGEPTVAQLPDLDSQDDSTVQLFKYEDGARYLTSSGEERTAEVLLYEIEGGGHTWPGADSMPVWLGPINRDINASAEIWEFFRGHELPAPPVIGDMIAGDYNGNGQVEQGDLDLVLLHWGDQLANPPDAGWINDLPTGTIDQAELDAVLLNWGNAIGLAAGSVPEPSAVMLLLFAIASVLVTRRRPSR